MFYNQTQPESIASTRHHKSSLGSCNYWAAWSGSTGSSRRTWSAVCWRCHLVSSSRGSPPGTGSSHTLMRWIACCTGRTEGGGPLWTCAFAVCPGCPCVAPTGHPVLNDPDQGFGQIKRWILYHEEASISTDETTQQFVFLRQHFQLQKTTASILMHPTAR